MPRKRPKTAADRPVYRPSTRPAVPDQLEPFLAGVELRRIIEQYGVANVQLVLGVIAEQARRELIARRSSEMLDAWKTNVRPFAVPVSIPPVSALRSVRESRSSPGYRRHREEHLDRITRRQARAKELEVGLAAMLTLDLDEWEKRDLREIVDRTIAGETVKQIAEGLGVSDRTIERRLEELRKAAVRQAD